MAFDDPATAAPADAQPIVTPTPPLFVQFPPPANVPFVGVQANTVIRPAFSATPPHDAGADVTPGSDDTWQASACHPAALTMIAQWMASQSRLAVGMAVANRAGLPDVAEQSPVYWAKWLWDPSGDPTQSAYLSADSHPPFLPRTPSGGKWAIDHGQLAKQFCAALSRNGAACELFSHSWSNPASDPHDRLTRFASLVFEHGPMAANLSIPYHFVLIYGVRPPFLYILDPGMEIIRLWAAPHLDNGTWTQSMLDKGFTIPSPTNAQAHVFRAFGSSWGCHVAIDATYIFPRVIVGSHKDEAGKKVKSYGARRFLDTIFLTESYSFPDCRGFPEFLNAPDPDGALPSVPAPLPTPSQPTPAASGASSPTDPSAPTGSPSSTDPASSTPVPSWLEGVAGAAAIAADPLLSFLYWAYEKEKASAGPSSQNSASSPPSALPGSVGASIAVSAHVLDEQGKDIDGVTVEVLAVDTIARGTTSGGAGFTTPPLPSGHYRVRASKSGLGPLLGSGPTQEGPAESTVDLVTSDGSVVISMADMSSARLFGYVVEEPGHRPLPGATVEIVGVYKDTTDELGHVVSYRFKPSTYDVYTGVPVGHYGPVPGPGQAPWVGDTTQRLALTAGDHGYIFQMIRVDRTSPPPPDGKTIDHSVFSILMTFQEIDHQAALTQRTTVTISHNHASSEFYGKWTLFDPTGEVIDTNREVLGVGDYSLDTSTLTARVDSPSSVAFGQWLLRLEIGDNYDDAPFVYAAPLPAWLQEPGVTNGGADPPIISSNILVAGTDFAEWFNREFFKKPHGGLFPAALNGPNFHSVWDQLSIFTGKSSISLNEFVAHLMIMYNETGGTLASIAEYPQGGKGDAYFFEPGPLRKNDRKASYNGPNSMANRGAGQQLLGWNVISNDDDVSAWDSREMYPSDQPDSVKTAARECDFYKYRGHGLNQLTFRANYQAHADKYLAAVSGKVSEEMTSEELDEAFKDPRVYLQVFRSYHASAAKALSEVIEGKFANYGSLVAGSTKYGSEVFEPRCKLVRDAMHSAGYTAS